MKICLVGAELLHADERTDRHDKRSYSLFAKEPKKVDAHLYSVFPTPAF